MEKLYETLAKAAFEDFESFFVPSINFAVAFKVANIHSPAKVVGNSEGSTVILSHYMLQERVQSVDDAMFFLIIIGHELAHYVNKHLAHTDESKIDSVAIEGWADFFGARIMFTLITYGNQTQKIIDELIAVPFISPASNSERQDLILRACGRALRRAYESLYRPSDGSSKYPRSEIRVGTYTAGVSSFFYRLFGSVSENWTFYVYRRLLFLTRLIEIYDGGSTIEPDSFFERTREIHVNLKGENNVFISSGLQQKYWNLIGTGYIDEPHHRELVKAKLKKEFDEWDFKIDS